MDNLKDLVRELTPEQLESHGILHRSRDGKFICPACGNGEGENGTGMDFKAAGNTFIAHCFRCEENFDIIKVLALHYNLDWQSQFKIVLHNAAVDFNLSEKNYSSTETEKNYSSTETEKNYSSTKTEKNYSSTKTEKNYSSTKTEKTETNQTKTEQAETEPELDFSDDYKKAHDALHNFLAERGGLFRALNEKTLNLCGAGFNPHYNFWSHGLKRWVNTPAVILPSSKQHFQARVLDDSIPERYSSPPKAKKDIFLIEKIKNVSTDDTVFVTEGAFDALSIWQVGFKAVALFGKAFTDLMLAQLAALPHRPNFIILFDGDDAGRLSADKAVKKLHQAGFKVQKAFLPDDFKDANEFLQNDSARLTVELQQIIDNSALEFDAQQQSFAQDENLPDYDFYTSKQIFPDCPIDLVIPSGFVFRKDGIFKFFKSKQGEERLEMISPTAVVISKVYYNASYAEGKIELIGYNRRQRVWKKLPTLFKLSMLSDPRALGKFCNEHGIYVDAKGASRMSAYLVNLIGTARNIDKIEEVIYHTHTGWEEEKFVYPTELGGKNPVLNGNFDFAGAFKAQGEEKEANHLLIDVLSASTIARITMGSALAAPLLKIIGAPNIQLHLCSPHSAGKSALLTMTFSLFGNPQKLHQTFASTANFLRKVSTKFMDMPVWIDEFQAASASVKAQIDDLVYEYAEGLEKGRLTVEAEEKPQETMRGSRLTSGEEPLTNFMSNQGAKGRVMELDFKEILPKRLSRQIHKFFGSKDASFGHHGRKMIEALEKMQDKSIISQKYDEYYEKIRYKAAKKNGWQGNFAKFREEDVPDEVIGWLPRHLQMFAASCTALEFFAQVIFEDEVHMQNYIGSLIDDDITFMVKNFNGARLTTNAERALPTILELPIVRADQFQIQTADGHFLSSLRSPRLGVRLANGDIGFYPSQLRPLLREIGFTSPDGIINDLHHLGIFDEGNEPRRQYQKRISVETDNGPQSRWLYIVRHDAEAIIDKRRTQALEESMAG